MRTFSPLSRALRARREDEKGEGGGGQGDAARRCEWHSLDC